MQVRAAADVRFSNDEKELEQYRIYVQFNQGTQLSQSQQKMFQGFDFNETRFRQLVEQYPELHNCLKNRTITLNFYTGSGFGGHVSVNGPRRNEDGSIDTVNYVGLSPDAQTVLKRARIAILGGPGKVGSEPPERMGANYLLQIELTITEQQYQKMADRINQDIQNSHNYHVFPGDQCYFYIDDVFDSIGIVGGLKNKISPEDFSEA